MIRTVVVDDHAVVRSGIRLLLEREEDIEVVGEAGNAQDAIFRARAYKPDVILLDVVMPGESGIDVLPRLLEEAPDAKVLVLSMQDDPRYVREAFAAGASGYVLKEAADEEVVAAVREIANGGHYVHPALGARIVEAEAEGGSGGGRSAVGPRARGLRLLALGHTNQEIARCSTSRCARPRRTARTSCRSCASRLAPSSSATRWPTVCSKKSTRPDALAADLQY